MNKQELAKYIDHTVLKPDARIEAVRRICAEAKQFGFASVCVNPTHVPFCVKELEGTGVDVCTVIGFPLGANQSATKAYEAALAVAEGATEVDMVINVGALKDGQVDVVRDDINAVVDAAIKANAKAIVKVIIETSLLTDEEKKVACQAAKEAGAHFVKTSTGFGGGGATVEDIALMRAVVGPDMGVKASGGIKNYDQTIALIEAGASRIGASAGVAIVEQA
ncbi:deoxyribose-phosphate aldolase [Desulfovibrio inopinatus]|uniref:deoxyribose-phosphate aldolase n=1 Tax=Desulfovibrio inopinatus TaxID=102109 RepID=UPI0004184AE4|nr:deoxyribose-phosphate aldolase [Desulfovibrio inopinatus]